MTQTIDTKFGECTTCEKNSGFNYIYSKENGEKIYFCMKCGENHPEEYFNENK